MSIENATKDIKKALKKGYLETEERFKLTELLFGIQESLEPLFELINDADGSPEEEDAGVSVEAIKQVEDITLLSQPNALIKDILDKKADSTIIKGYKKAVFVLAGKNIGIATAGKTEEELLKEIKRVVLNEI